MTVFCGRDTSKGSKVEEDKLPLPGERPISVWQPRHRSRRWKVRIRLPRIRLRRWNPWSVEPLELPETDRKARPIKVIPPVPPPPAVTQARAARMNDVPNAPESVHYAAPPIVDPAQKVGSAPPNLSHPIEPEQVASAGRPEPIPPCSPEQVPPTPGLHETALHPNRVTAEVQSEHDAEQCPEIALPELKLPHPRVLPVAIALALTAILIGAAVFTSGSKSVTVEVDGDEMQLTTRQRLVGDLLAEAGIPLGPGILVSPGLDSTVESEMRVTVEYAHMVVIEADGSLISHFTHQTRPEAILAEAGVTFGPNDRIEVEGNGIYPPVIKLHRALEVTIEDGDEGNAMMTTRSRVGEALEEADIRLTRADRLSPDPISPISPGLEIGIARAMPVTVDSDGNEFETRTFATTVGDLMREIGIELGPMDYTLPPTDSPVEPGMKVTVVRVSERFVTEREPIPFETVWRPDPELELDHHRVVQNGSPGVRERRIRVIYENGVEVSRAVHDEWVAQEPISQVIGYGTRIAIRTLDTPDGQIEYWRVIRMLATSYTASTAGTPPDHPAYGLTAVGWEMRRGIVAVDPAVINLYSHVYVPGYGFGVAGDTGGAIKGRRIDLGYDEDDFEYWYTWVDVYILTPIPDEDQIRWVIPR